MSETDIDSERHGASSRHILLSRWKTPDWKQLCKQRCLQRLRDIHETRSLLVDRMRNISISNDDSDESGNEDNDHYDITPDYNNEGIGIGGNDEIESVIRHELLSFTSDIEMCSLNEHELEEYMLSVRQEFLEEQTKSWEGLQTKEDQQRSIHFLTTLQRNAIICPYCKQIDLELNERYLSCISCGIRFHTNLTFDEIITRIYSILNHHTSSSCSDQFPQFNVNKRNLVIYCDTCPLNQLILEDN